VSSTVSTPARSAPDAGDRADPPPATLAAAAELLRALAAPLRIAIVLRLRRSPCCVHELVGVLGAPQPLVSQHLRVLKDAGVVHGDRLGREVLYRLADEHPARIATGTVAHVTQTRAGLAPAEGLGG
jgi:DNA-binding transcriptional ArsR family regulator